ncbi:MAG: circadian clock KaiB family protein [Thermodesulfobacteriota bacterium]
MKKEKISDKPGSPKYYHFQLFVAGDEINSRRTKETLHRLCTKYLPGQHKIEIIDVLKDYKAALENQIFFAPTLVILSPPPQTKIVGALNDPQKILDVLGLARAKEEA